MDCHVLCLKDDVHDDRAAFVVVLGAPHTAQRQLQVYPAASRAPKVVVRSCPKSPLAAVSAFPQGCARATLKACPFRGKFGRKWKQKREARAILSLLHTNRVQEALARAQGSPVTLCTGTVLDVSHP
jgi:hypothetical protein